MRSYSCKWHFINSEDKLEKSFNGACWAGLNRIYNENTGKYITSTYADTFRYVKDQTIYIDDYTDKETKEYVELLVSVINEITPCSLEKVEGKTYIKFKLLRTYDQSLILLNFIRYLWCTYGTAFDTNKFFETLKKDKTYSDPLERLLHANKLAVGTFKYNAGHSNIHPPEKLIIKKSKDLLKWRRTSTALFLTTN